MMTTPYIRIGFDRMLPPPADTFPHGARRVEVGEAFYDPDDGAVVWKDAALDRYGPDLDTLAAALRRARPNRSAVCYGDVFTNMATTLGEQSIRWAIDARLGLDRNGVPIPGCARG